MSVTLPAEVVITTSTAPAELVGVIVLTVVLLITPNDAVTPPNVTLVVDWNPVPVIVTTVPPVVDPLDGVRESPVGAST